MGAISQGVAPAFLYTLLNRNSHLRGIIVGVSVAGL
jgi:hypothetical protein